MTNERKALQQIADLGKVYTNAHAAANWAIDIAKTVLLIPELSCDGVPNEAWADVVRLAGAEGGDAARNIAVITGAYVDMRNRLNESLRKNEVLTKELDLSRDLFGQSLKLLTAIQEAALPIREWDSPSDANWPEVTRLLEAINRLLLYTTEPCYPRRT